MPEIHIFAHNLSKTYRVPERDEGLRASIGSLWRRKYRDVEAVKDISFTIEAGEMVGFLGPNGAGKTTTIKILAGLLYPTAGEVRVAGYIPWQRKPDYLRRMSMVMGNKSQMLWDIPPRDSFRVLASIYRVPPSELKPTLDELYDLLDMEAVLAKPVRNLSLGERMKCELVAALLYRPQVLFLDEPTLGLDISMQRRLRQFVAEYNRRTGATVILTSHYMADVEALCSRIIMINHGTLLYDGALHKLATQYAPYKLLRVTVNDDYKKNTVDLPGQVTLVEQTETSWTFNVPQDDVPTIAAHILNTLPVLDIAIEDPAIETIIDTIYQGGVL